MPKKTRVRETENPLGRKINDVMAEKGMAGDYGRLAAIFEVATPSTYDWVTHGRLGKERFSKLVEWSGRSLDWWFDIRSEHVNSGVAERNDDLDSCQVLELSRSRWPLRASIDTLMRLDPDDLQLIDAYIQGIVDLRAFDARKSQRRR